MLNNLSSFEIANSQAKGVIEIEIVDSDLSEDIEECSEYDITPGGLRVNNHSD